MRREPAPGGHDRRRHEEDRLRGTAVVCLSSVDWDDKWQPHQELMTALARDGNHVLFIENTGVRSPVVGDWRRLRQRAGNWRRGLRSVGERLHVHAPLLLPLPYSALARSINHRVLAAACRRWGRPHRARPLIVWTFLPTPLANDLIRTIEPDLTVYQCLDDFASSSKGARRVRQSEDHLLREADVVFVTSERLRASAEPHREVVHLFPSGVRYERFAEVRDTPREGPSDLDALAGPIVGCTGGVNRKTDQALLIEVARLLPDIHFVIVGPVEERTLLSSCPNVHLLGYRPHVEVPRYLKAMQVALIPYHVDEFTSHVYPATLNEYLAMGLPVVATPLVEIRRFNERHGELVTIADRAESFAAAIRTALQNTCPDAVRKRIDVAYDNRWELKIAHMFGLVARALDTRSSMKGA